MLGHPLRAGQMAVVNMTRAFWIHGWIKGKQDGHDLSPICTVGIGIQKAHVEFGMRPVVIGQDRTFGRCVKEVCVRQSAPFFGTLLPIEASVNHFHPLGAQGPNSMQ